MILLYIALVFIVAFVLFVPVRVDVGYQSNDYSLKLKVLGRCFNLKKLLSGGNAKKTKTHTQAEQPDEADKKLIQKINDIYLKVSYFKNVYNASSKTINKSFITENIGADISFGTSDAALTGMLTGAVWALCYEALGLLSILSTVKSHKFNVDSVYDRCIFEARAEAVFKITVFGALKIAISVLYNVKKYKKHNKLRSETQCQHQ